MKFWFFTTSQGAKQPSLQWRHTPSSKNQIIPNHQNSQKHVYCFLGQKKHSCRQLHVSLHICTLNATAYCACLRRLHQSIQDKMRGMLTRGICFLHDNYYHHCASDNINVVFYVRVKHDPRPTLKIQHTLCFFSGHSSYSILKSNLIECIV